MSTQERMTRFRPGKADNKFGVPISEAGQIFGKLAGLPGGESARRGGAYRQPAGRPRPVGSRLYQARHAWSRRFAVRGTRLTHVDLGGGLGVPYRVGEVLPEPAEYGAIGGRG